MITLSKEHEKAVLEMVAADLLATIRPEIAEMQLLTVEQAAGILGCGTARAKTLLKSYVDLGERVTRIPLSAVRKLIADRTTDFKRQKTPAPLA